MSNISQYIRKFNPFTGKLDFIGSNTSVSKTSELQNDSGFVTNGDVMQVVYPVKAELNASIQDVRRTITLMQNSISQTRQIAEQSATQSVNSHWETYPVLASESGDEFSQLASGIQNNQGVLFWMSILSPITFSECIIYAVSHPSDYEIQVGIYDEDNNLLYKTVKHMVTNLGTVRFAFVDNEGNPKTCSLTNDTLYKIAIWSSVNNFRILAAQDCSSAFQSIRQLMSAKLVQNADGLTDVAQIEEGSYINRFPYIKLVG